MGRRIFKLFSIALLMAAQFAAAMVCGGTNEVFLERLARELLKCPDIDAAKVRLAEAAKENPLQTDWLLADIGGNLEVLVSGEEKVVKLFAKAAQKYEEKVGMSHDGYGNERGCLASAIARYLKARTANREKFLSDFFEGRAKCFAYVERIPIRPSFYAYTEGLSDARGEKHFHPNSKLCLFTFNGKDMERMVLLESKDGTIRDPDVSYDGKRLLFAWKKNRQDDYSLYEMDISTRHVRLLAKSPKQADYEGKYLPTGEIAFSSTRCEHSTGCYTTEVSNMYIMGADGTRIRRVGFDQVHTTYPTVCENGDIVYTRWDYNDRGQVYTQALFTMKPDGTFQNELYGNKSWAPTAMGHARQIPGFPNKFVCILHGHHTPQQGWLAKIDVSKGRQEGAGITAIAPLREIPKACDRYAQDGIQFRYPYPLADGAYIVSANILSQDCGSGDMKNRMRRFPFRLYAINDAGEREILVPFKTESPNLSQMQAVAVAKREIPMLEKSSVDYSNDKGYCLIRNVYEGMGTKGLKKGTIEKVRVVRLHYRRAPVGNLPMTSLDGAGMGHAFTPIALGNGSWDVKEILGEVPVEPDGSAYFEIPARTPVYFQLVDKNGCVAATMRSWTAMQPNEFYACMGCHGNKNENSLKYAGLSPQRKPEKLRPFYDVKGGFSFRKVIQPILNENCIRCHNDRSAARLHDENDYSKLKSVADYAPVSDEHIKDFIEENKHAIRRAFSLLDVPIPNRRAGRNFNDAYYNLLRPSMKNKGNPFTVDYKSELVNWIGAQSAPVLQAPYTRGSANSKLYTMLRDGHSHLMLSKEELDKICAWIDLYVPFCGDYLEANIWSPKEKEYYEYYLKKASLSEERELQEIERYLLGESKLSQADSNPPRQKAGTPE